MRLTSSRLANAALTLLCAAAALYAAVRWLLPWAAPFLLAFFLAALLEPAVLRLCRCRIPRPLAAGLALIAALGAAAGLLWLLLRRIAAELGELTERAPELVRALTETLERWEAALRGALASAPEVLGVWLDRALAGAEEGLLRLPGALSQRALRLVPTLAAAAPAALMFTVTAVIGAYCFASG